MKRALESDEEGESDEEESKQTPAETKAAGPTDDKKSSATGGGDGEKKEEKKDEKKEEPPSPHRMHRGTASIDKPLWTLVPDRDSKQRPSVRATTDIKAGGVIWSEAAVVSEPHELKGDFDPPAAFLLALLGDARFAHVTPGAVIVPDSVTSRDSKYSDLEWKRAWAQAKLHAIEVDSTKEGEEPRIILQIFPRVLQCRHSCWPNAQPLGDHLLAVRDIAKGEEITVCYRAAIDWLIMPTPERRRRLQTVYALSCKCVRCALTAAQSVARPHNRHRIASMAIDMKIDSILDQPPGDDAVSGNDEKLSDTEKKALKGEWEALDTDDQGPAKSFDWFSAAVAFVEKWSPHLAAAHWRLASVCLQYVNLAHMYLDSLDPSTVAMLAGASIYASGLVLPAKSLSKARAFRVLARARKAQGDTPRASIIKEIRRLDPNYEAIRSTMLAYDPQYDDA